jgi:hypothetical protein
MKRIPRDSPNVIVVSTQILFLKSEGVDGSIRQGLQEGFANLASSGAAMTHSSHGAGFPERHLHHHARILGVQ